MKENKYMSIEIGKRVLSIEAKAIEDLISRLDKDFTEAVELLYACKGRVVVSGMGKSGLIGKKISATFASTGTPSFFLHPAEGIHGDVGMVMKDDIILAISNSGETDEIVALLPTFKRMNLRLICLTGRYGSTLSENSDVILDVSVKEEACPMNIVPTASTTATLAMGDALAIALLEKRGFKEDDFALSHPGGTLGRRLLLKVEDIMHKNPDIPTVNENSYMKDVICEMTSRKLGMTTVIANDTRFMGIITDGDLRRLLERWTGMEKDLFKLMAKEVMTKNPKVISRDALAVAALKMMEDHSITSIVVLSEDMTVEGVIHLHDLLKKRIV